MKFRLALLLILTVGFQAITTSAERKETNSLRRGLKHHDYDYKMIETSPKYCVMIRGDKDNVVTGSCTDEDWYKTRWYYDSESGEVVSSYSEECLDVSQTNMNQVITWPCHGGTNQKWDYDSYNSRFVSIESGKCMDLINSNVIRVSDCDSSSAQKFYLEGVEPPPPTNGKPIKDNGNYCLGVMSRDGIEVVMQYCDGKENQNWVSSKGIMKNTYYNKCLDVDLSNGQENVIAWKECHGRDNQQWEYSNGAMKSLYNGKCMAAESNKSLKLYQCSGNPNQKFYYEDFTPPPPPPPPPPPTDTNYPHPVLDKHWPSYLSSRLEFPQAENPIVRPTNTKEAEAQGWVRFYESCDPFLGEPWLYKGKRSYETSVTMYFTPKVGNTPGILSGIEVDVYGYVHDCLVGTYFSEKRESDDGTYHSIAVALQNGAQHDLCDSRTPFAPTGEKYIAIRSGFTYNLVPTKSTMSSLRNDWAEGSYIKGMGIHWYQDTEGGSNLSWKAGNLVPISVMYDPIDKGVNAIFFLGTGSKSKNNKDRTTWWDVPGGLGQVEKNPDFITRFPFCVNFCGDCGFTGSPDGYYTTMHWWFKDPAEIQHVREDCL